MGRYLPGHKDGGPIRSISHMIEMLGDEYEFFIACLDRDHGDVTPYPGIRTGEWQQTGKAKVFYIAPYGFTEGLIRKLSEDKDLIYLCGFYDDYGWKTLLLKRRGMIQTPLVLASMGTLSAGALAQHGWRKHCFIAACKAAGLFNGLTWSVSSELEADELRRVIGRNARYVIAEDLPGIRVPGIKKIKAAANKIVFLSRISPKKNLLGAIEALQEVKHVFNFTICGPCEDERYWHRCRERLKQSSFQWSYSGDVPPEQVQEVLSEHDIFLFPTLGENYGHVIFEALSVGCIPVISDRTPWKEIENRHAGYVLPLNDIGEFGRKINEIIELPMEPRRAMAEAGVEIARACVERNKAHTGYREIFG